MPLISGRCYRPIFLQLFLWTSLRICNVVIGKLGKLVHKQKCSHDFLFYFINYSIIIVQVRYIIIETKKLSSIGYNWFLSLHEYSGEGRGTHLLVIIHRLVHLLICFHYCFTSRLLFTLFLYPHPICQPYVKMVCIIYIHVWCGCHRMVVGFTTGCAISVYHH